MRPTSESMARPPQSAVEIVLNELNRILFRELTNTQGGCYPCGHGWRRVLLTLRLCDTLPKINT